MDEIDRFLKAPNFYAALGLDHKNITDEKIDKAYKKYAIKFHPDKNKNPKASQAFIKLGEMKETLKNTSKRNAYNQSIFHPPNNYPKYDASKIYTTRPKEWSEHTNEFYYDPDRTSHTKIKKRKNKILPLFTIFILLIIFLFIANVDPFSDSITKESLSKIIKFSLENENPMDFTSYLSKILHVQFYIPKDWEKEHIYALESTDWHALREQIRYFADEVYKDKLASDCEKEKKSPMRSTPSCYRLQAIL